jgi:hypothetical protein
MYRRVDEIRLSHPIVNPQPKKINDQTAQEASAGKIADG